MKDPGESGRGRPNEMSPDSQNCIEVHSRREVIRKDKSLITFYTNTI